jgi:hypothetical protein
MTASLMFSWRRIKSVLTIGAAVHAGEFRSHAWLRVGEIYVVGGRGSAKFYPLAHYASPCRASSTEFRHGHAGSVYGKELAYDRDSSERST